MWLMTRHGFYSIVKKDDGIHVRSRERQDIENLKAGAGLNRPTLETPSNDYRYRIIVQPEDLYTIMWWLTATCDYPNFKARIDATLDQRRKPYHEVWSVLARALGAYGKEGSR